VTSAPSDCKLSTTYTPGIATAVGTPEVLAEDHPHISQSLAKVVNITVKETTLLLVLFIQYLKDGR